MFNKQDIAIVNKLLQKSKNIIITSHKSPDGDSVGSSLALFHFLKKINIKSTICHPDKMPYFLEWLDDANSIITLEKDEKKVKNLFINADLIFCLDYNHPSRIGKMTDLLTKSKAKKIMIDHHQNPDKDFVDFLFSDPNNSSTCQLIYEFITDLNQADLIYPAIATPMYCGIMTDTGSFRFPSTTKRTHLIIADLIDKGVNNSKIHENTFDTNSINKLKLNGFAIAEKLTILDNKTIAFIALSKQELKKYNYTKGDTEGLVNVALGINGIKMAAFFKEDEGYVKISFRAKGNTFVNELANTHFQGGGHKYAAGGKFEGSLNNAIEKFVTVANKYVK